jgi:hypothetical protein
MTPHPPRSLRVRNRRLTASLADDPPSKRTPLSRMKRGSRAMGDRAEWAGALDRGGIEERRQSLRSLHQSRRNSLSWRTHG